MVTSITLHKKSLKPEHLFILSSVVVNGGNYLYNLLLGRLLQPTQFADAALVVTLFLGLSFVAMTVQITTTKFSVLFAGTQKEDFLRWAYRISTILGTILGGLLAIFATNIQSFFQTSSAWVFVLLGIAIPFYFAMSCKRGNLQGNSNFTLLSASYQVEMWVRLAATFALLLFFDIPGDIAVASSILVSVLLGILPQKPKRYLRRVATLDRTYFKSTGTFFLITLCYECTLIICNNSDILLVKHYFEANQAGLYVSLALIGRVVYFLTWMLVMLLLPKVIYAKKNQQDPRPIFKKYFLAILWVSALITCACFLFPEEIVLILFGSKYLSIAPLLGSYALATSLFALSNVFAYYFLSLDHYLPIAFSFIMGMSQIALIVWFHNSLQTIVWLQVGVMGILLMLQFGYFLVKNKRG